MRALQLKVSIPRFIAANALRLIFGPHAMIRGPARTIRLVDIPEPAILSEDWVKLKTIYCGFCGSDLNLITLHDSPTASPFTSFPCVPGHEIVAEIVQVGTGVEGFAEGERVVIDPALACDVRGISPRCPSCEVGRMANCENFARGDLPPGMFLGINSRLNGGFAPYLVAHKNQLYKVPDGVSSRAAVMVEPLAVALQAVLDNYPAERDQVLVVGGGVIGNLIIQVIKALQSGCEVSVIEPSQFAAGLSLEAGAVNCIPYKDVFDKVSRLTSATKYKPMLGMDILMGGFNRIFDTVGVSSTLNLSMRLLAAMGTLSVVGIGNDVKLDLTPLWLKLQTVRGVFGSGIAEYRGQKKHIFQIGLEMLKAGQVDTEKLVTHVYPIEKYLDLIGINLNKDRHKAVKTVLSFI